MFLRTDAEAMLTHTGHHFKIHNVVWSNRSLSRHSDGEVLTHRYDGIETASVPTYSVHLLKVHFFSALALELAGVVMGTTCDRPRDISSENKKHTHKKKKHPTVFVRPFSHLTLKKCSYAHV